MGEKREADRDRSFARALLSETGTYGHVADISISGFRVRVPGDHPRLLVGRQVISISLEDLDIPLFQVVAEYRWSRSEPKSTLIGFQAISFIGDGQARYDALHEHYRTMDTGRT
jgi:hypothetical protein